MGSIFKAPKMPPPPPIIMPEPKDVPDYEDEERKKLEQQKLEDAEKKRTGRRSTILTGTGLTDIPEENIDQKTLLGG